MRAAFSFFIELKKNYESAIEGVKDEIKKLDRKTSQRGSQLALDLDDKIQKFEKTLLENNMSTNQ